MRQMQGGGRGGAFSFGKSRARMLDETNNSITFADVAGCDEAKEEVQELVEFLRDPSKFQKLGGRIPRGVLLVGSPGHRQDPAGQGHRRRGQGAVLLDLGFRLRRDVRRRRRGARARHVRERQEARAVHHLHRRDRRGRPPAWSGPGRRQRRARADAEPDAGRDGRLRDRHGRHRRSPRPTARTCSTRRCCVRAASTARSWCRCPTSAAASRSCRVHMRKVPIGADVKARRDRARHAGLLRRGPRQPGQRGGAVRRAPQRARGRDGRLREGQGQGHDGRRAQIHGHVGGGADQYRVPRVGPRAGRQAGAEVRPGAQGDDHSARPRARPDDAVARAGPLRVRPAVPAAAASRCSSAAASPKKCS